MNSTKVDVPFSSSAFTLTPDANFSINTTTGFGNASWRNTTSTLSIASTDQTNFYIGLTLAILSSLFIGTSFIFKKRGLIRAAKQTNVHAAEGSVSYLRDWVWWSGMILMGVGEVANFVAYSFAPATLVTPLGALSVIVSAVLSSKFLHETLNIFGQCGCVLCLIGSTMIVTNAPQDRAINNMIELAGMLIDPAFLVYVGLVCVANVVLIFYCSPRWGTSNPLVYISITGSMGSLTVMSCKSIGVAMTQLFAGQTAVLSFWLTWVTFAVAAFCIAVQMNFLNRALDAFNTAMVTPILYIVFTTFVLIASALLFKEWGSLPAANIVNILCGFLVIVVAVFLISVFKELKLGWRALVDFVFRHNSAGLQTMAASYGGPKRFSDGDHCADVTPVDAAVLRNESMTSADDSINGAHYHKKFKSRNLNDSDSEAPIDRYAEPPATRSEAGAPFTIESRENGFPNPTFDDSHAIPATLNVSASINHAEGFAPPLRLDLARSVSYNIHNNPRSATNTVTTRAVVEPSLNSKPDRFVFTIENETQSGAVSDSDPMPAPMMHDTTNSFPLQFEDSSASRTLFIDRPKDDLHSSLPIAGNADDAFASSYTHTLWNTDGLYQKGMAREHRIPLPAANV